MQIFSGNKHPIIGIILCALLANFYVIIVNSVIYVYLCDTHSGTVFYKKEILEKTPESEIISHKTLSYKFGYLYKMVLVSNIRYHNETEEILQSVDYTLLSGPISRFFEEFIIGSSNILAQCSSYHNNAAIEIRKLNNYRSGQYSWVEDK